jgi:type 2 lantibiotic biosynthesis protein LanM
MKQRWSKPISPIRCPLHVCNFSFSTARAAVHRARIGVSSAEMQDWLSAIAAKASTIRERLGPDFEPAHGEGSRELADARMHAWLAAAARGDHPLFQRRLAWDGLDEHTAERVVAPLRLRSAAPLPPWTTALAEVMRPATPSSTDDRCLDREDPVPFEDLLIPFIIWARSGCMRQAASAYGAFTAAAHAMLERQLLKVLSGLASRTLLVELAADTAEQRSPLGLLSNPEPSREAYNDFVARMLPGGLIAFFQEYAALARLLASTTMFWLDATAELLQRFCRDRRAICDALGISGDSDVDSVESCASDPHNGLRSVVLLKLGSGERIIYKPRPMTIEAVWNDLLQFCVNLGAPADFRSYRILDCGGYGWAEYVRKAPCRDCEEVSRYVTRAGALLAIVYLLGGSDCHADNIIPAGEYPVLIDVETLLAPNPRDCSAHTDASRAAHRLLWQSVMTTFMLPRWVRSLNGDRVIDASAFGAIPGEAVPANGPWWVDVNTDRMRITRMPPPLEQKPAAREGGLSRSVYQHEAELIRGFEAMYRFLASHRNDLLLPDSPFQRLRCAAVRFVYRSTGVYAAILDCLTRPEFLRDGAERSIEIEELAYAALSGERFDGRPGWAAIWRSERDAVERGDVPHFTTMPGELALYSSSEVVAPAWFPECSHDIALERLRSLNDPDLRFQVDIIQSTICSRVVRPEGGRHSDEPVGTALPPGPEDPQAWVGEAVAIARTLAEQAIRGADGSFCWIQRAWSRKVQANPPVAELQVTEADLYSGSVGIALFFAAVERVAPRSGLLAFALGAIQPLIAHLSVSGDDLADESGLGGLTGIGSAVYALTCMSELLGRTDLMQHAERAANLITEKRIDADVALDVTSGSAGALLALLTLHEANGSLVALERATMCGQRLLARLEDAGNDVRGIRTLEGRFLTGFSHGAAGMAYALCRLFGVSGDATFLVGARQLIAFERAAYSSLNDDWPDLRHPGAPQFMPSWCHGAPGIGLARVAGLNVIDHDETRREIDRALAITQEKPLGGGDCVCCGTFGRIETLWTAGRMLQRADLCSNAQSLAWHRVLEAKRSGTYEPRVPPAGRFRCLDLFQGLAGVGYTFLRLALPDVVPEILLLSRGNLS